VVSNREKDEWFMKEALKEARKAALKGEVPIGAVIVKENKIIARGHNLRETTADPLAHAEIIAIKKASIKLRSWRHHICHIRAMHHVHGRAYSGEGPEACVRLS